MLAQLQFELIIHTAEIIPNGIILVGFFTAGVLAGTTTHDVRRIIYYWLVAVPFSIILTTCFALMPSILGIVPELLSLMFLLYAKYIIYAALFSTILTLIGAIVGNYVRTRLIY